MKTVLLDVILNELATFIFCQTFVHYPAGSELFWFRGAWKVDPVQTESPSLPAGLSRSVAWKPVPGPAAVCLSGWAGFLRSSLGAERPTPPGGSDGRAGRPSPSHSADLPEQISLQSATRVSSLEGKLRTNASNLRKGGTGQRLDPGE